MGVQKAKNFPICRMTRASKSRVELAWRDQPQHARLAPYLVSWPRFRVTIRTTVLLYEIGALHLLRGRFSWQ